MADTAQLTAGLTEIFRSAPSDAEVVSFQEICDEDGLQAAFASAVDSDGASAARTVIAFYQVFYGRQPDEGGLDFWTEQLETGAISLNELADNFAEASEFNELFGDREPTEVVFAQYRNVLGREPDFEGLTFWTNQVNSGNITIADLGRFFATSTEFEETADGAIDAFLINTANGEQDFADISLFEEVLGNGVVAVEGVISTINDDGDSARVDLALNTQAGAETATGGAEGGSGISVLRLTGDADARIDFTDPSSQLEQLDLDGDGINPGEADFNVRELIPVSGFEIIDAHARGDALLDPTNTTDGFTGDLLFDGTGFDGDGNATDGNIVLGGSGSDTLIGGIGNDFFSAGAGFGDDIRGGRNADFIYHELSSLDTAFTGAAQLLDGGSTFDDTLDQDNDWLLLEASDDEEPVRVVLGEDDTSGSGNQGSDNGVGSVASARLGDSAQIRDIENVNASGNFYKFLDITQVQAEVVGLQLFGFVGELTDGTAVDYSTTTRVQFSVGGTAVVADLSAAARTSNAGIIAAVEAAIDAAGLEGLNVSFEAPIDTVTIANGTEVQPGGLALTIRDDLSTERDFSAIAVTGDPAADGQAFNQGALNIPGDITGDGLFDAFFGDNRDFSADAVEHRVANLSPGVTAQLIVDGSFADNTIIGGYDNDTINGNSGNDLLFGGDLEFLLTHRHNANLFDSDGTISVNADANGIANDGRDFLDGGIGNDSLVFEADGGSYNGGTGNDTLLLTTFSSGRLDTTVRSTDGSLESRFLGVDGIGGQASQDLLGFAETNAEAAAVNALTEDNVLRFDLGFAIYQGNGGADRTGTADQTNYEDGIPATSVVGFENFNASGLGGIDYLAAGGNAIEDGASNRLVGGLNFENQQNYRASTSDIDVRGTGGRGADGAQGANFLATGLGNDTLEGRGGDDILTGYFGDDTFIVSTNAGANLSDPALGSIGDDQNIIGRLRDEDNNGIADGDLTDLEQDFRAGSASNTVIVTPATPATLNIEISDSSVQTDFTAILSIQVTIDNQTVTVDSPTAAAGTSSQVYAGLLQTALNANPNLTGVVVNAINATEIDVIFTQGNVSNVAATFATVPGQVNGFLQEFDQAADAVTREDTITENDNLVFRSYQDREDGELTQDFRASLGIDAYAEDLVAGFSSNGTTLAEQQRFEVDITNLKDGDVLSVQVNGEVYTVTTGFDDITGSNITGEATESVVDRLVDLINDTISAANMTTRDGALFVSSNDNGVDSATLSFSQNPMLADGAEHVFLFTPIVTATNPSGGEPPVVSDVREVGDTTVDLVGYDGRSISDGGAGLNSEDNVGRAITAGDDRDDGRFITFEGIGGESINRSVLQTSEGQGTNRETGLNGLDILTFASATGVVQTDNGIDLNDTDTGNAFIREDGPLNPGNTNGGSGLPDTGNFSGLHGDDLLIGSDGRDYIDGRTGDDRVIGSKSDLVETTAIDVDRLFGGVNVVLSATGAVQRDTNDSLSQTANDPGEVLLSFTDTLIFEQGSEREEALNKFGTDAQFAVSITDTSVDGGLIGRVNVDDDNDGDIDHITDFQEFEVVKLFSDDQNNSIQFGGNLDGVTYDTQSGVILNDGTQIGTLNGVNEVTGTVNDDIFNGSGRDEIFNGGAGADIINGGAGADIINGGAGADIINGGAGADIINGGAGVDTLTGGGGVDTFAFGAMPGDDAITDFVSGTDMVDLSALAGVDFADLTIAAGSFMVDNGNDDFTINLVNGATLVEDDFIFA